MNALAHLVEGSKARPARTRPASWPIQRVLCPVDLSEESREALEYACALASWWDASLTLLHVLPTVPTPGGELSVMHPPLSPDPTMRRRAVDEMNALAKTPRDADVKARIGVDYGCPAERILEWSRTMEADVIVLGTHTLSRVERWLLGSVAETVLRRAPCPVLTVPRNTRAGRLSAKRSPFTTIVCAVGLEEASSATTLEYAAGLGRGTGARVTAVHVLDAYVTPASREVFDDVGYVRALETEARARLRRVAREALCLWPIEEVVLAGVAAEEVLRVSADCEADLLVVGGSGRGPVNFLFPSTAQQIVRGAACPVLSVRFARK
jgi:universal stress protein A